MCEVYVKADPMSYESRSRTVRIHGVITTIRLENEVWDTLAEMAASEGCRTNQLIVKFHDELLAHHAEVLNFASFLRVSCLRFLRRGASKADSPAATAALDKDGRDGLPPFVSLVHTTPHH
ncbi:MAG: ribbon-helix-helix domain-containing protein [Betaproteobacteria bacterium]|nr:ribbon-helix-helix domain-containing protein [Betaproteobacteria bacterium]